MPLSMNSNPFISIVLDTRRPKANGKYPVKLRVFTKYPRIQKLYPIGIEFTQKEFESIWETVKPRSEYREARFELQTIEKKALEVAKELKSFDFELFEKKLFRKAGIEQDIVYQYGLIIQKLKELNRFGTASNYELSLKSLQSFIKAKTGKEGKAILFTDITVDWLVKYEAFMIDTKERSRTTVSMYLRALRTVFNTAIANKEIDSELYPFGKRKYQVPSVKNVKKALTSEQLKRLFNAAPKTPEQAKARDFWFFSYSCNGMNIKDIAMLRNENIQGDKIVFYRAKTINTSKADLKPITVYLNDFSSGVIAKYGNPNGKATDLVFSIISDKNAESLNHTLTKNFTRFINQNIKKLAISENITAEISTYWARHSFATSAIRNGASMEFVGEALNHSNMKTTQGYFAGFEEEDKKQLMKELMNF